MEDPNDLTAIKTLINNLDYETAAKLLETKYASNPNNIEVIDLLSETYYELDKLDLAKTLIDKSISLDPEHNGEKYYVLAQLIIETNPKLSFQYFQKGITIYINELNSNPTKDPNEIKSNIASGYASIIDLHMHSLCDEVNAENICEESVKEGMKYDSQSVELLLQLSNLRIVRGRDDEAKQALEMIDQYIDKIDVNDNEYPSRDMMVNISKNYAELSLFDKAIKYMDIAMKMDDEDIEGWYYLSYYHYNITNYEDAMKCLKNLNKVHAKLTKENKANTPQVHDIIDAAKTLYNDLVTKHNITNSN